MNKQTEALKLALKALEQARGALAYVAVGNATENPNLARSTCSHGVFKIDKVEPVIREALAEQPAIKQDLTPEQPAQPQQEPVVWISVKDALPKAVRGVSYKASLTDVVLVLHSDRPDYPITAHAVVGEGLGAGVAIPTEGASEHPEIAWYSECRDLNNPFGLKNDDYGRYLPKVFGSKITHWKPIDTSPPYEATPLASQRSVKPWLRLTDEEVKHEWVVWRASIPRYMGFAKGIEAKLKEKNT